MSFLLKTLSITGLLLLSVGAQATDWQINNAQSQLSFVSTKKVNIAEVHSFDQLSGQINADGDVEVMIDLESVDTGIDIRNSRMQEFLFNVMEFPKARITAKIAPDLLDTIEVGQIKADSISATLDLHGHQQALTFDVLITKLAENKLLVVSSKPVILDVSDYQLVEGVEKLRELAGLPSISYAVPVSYYLMLNAAN